MSALERTRGINMKNPTQCWNWIKEHTKPEWKTAFFSAAVLGLLIHMPVMLSDIPNHDGLASMHFDQNMITSGRWFLSIACGFSSYYTLPWLIGLIAVFLLALTSAALTEFLEVHNKGAIVLISGLLTAFPAIASTFAYVFTMDGYMLALLLAVLAVLLTGRYRLGFLGGAVCLAFSLGTYQSYLPFAVLLSIYGILMLAMGSGTVLEKIKKSLRYLYMGVIGAALYFVILQVLLKVQGKVLDTYQGISGMGTVEKNGILDTVKHIYADFASFTIKGNVLINNVFSAAALLVLTVLTLVTLVKLCAGKKWWRSPWFYIILVLLAVGLPVATNMILIISPDVTYHLLMRYQWVLYLILMTAFVSRYGGTAGFGEEAAVTDREGKGTASMPGNGKSAAVTAWALLLSAGILVFNYAVTDNIAYSNLEKRYEKTYAYCLRLLDRIEQTQGYYQGIPIAMVGVVGDEEYPITDITLPVTGNMIGMNGDVLLYTGANYEAFMKHYLGATLNFLPPQMEEIYHSEEYREMDSFPGENSIRIVDGVMYIKTENVDRS